jgi:putative polyhydroxyalkanoate system protein
MSTISIRRQHSLSKDKAVDVADSVAKQLGEEYGMRSKWKGDTLHFERSGVNGTLRLAPKEMLIDVKLGMLLFALRDTIATQIEKKLDTLLSPAAKTTKRRS